MRLELVTVPVSDIDRAKRFYVDQVGFSVEKDVRVDETHRFRASAAGVVLLRCADGRLRALGPRIARGCPAQR
jgi:catechol 2,3-dioxygenase-like lactoylglutathione lyase family enzyme